MDISYSELRQNLKKTIDYISDNHEPAIITSNRKRAAVMISYDDYCAMEETVYLLKSPANAKRLLDAADDVKKGKVIRRKLLDDET